MTAARSQRIKAPTTMRIEGTGAWVAVMLDSLGRALDRGEGLVEAGSPARFGGALVRDGARLELTFAGLPPQAARLVVLTTGAGPVRLDWLVQAPEGPVAGGPIEIDGAGCVEALRVDRRGGSWAVSAAGRALGELAATLTGFGATAPAAATPSPALNNPAPAPTRAAPPKPTTPRPQPQAQAQAARPQPIDTRRPPRPQPADPRPQGAGPQPAASRPPTDRGPGPTPLPPPGPARPTPSAARKRAEGAASPRPELVAVDVLGAALRAAHQASIAAENRRRATIASAEQEQATAVARCNQEGARADALQLAARQSLGEAAEAMDRIVPGTRAAMNALTPDPSATRASAAQVEAARTALRESASHVHSHLLRASGRGVVSDAVASTFNID